MICPLMSKPTKEKGKYDQDITEMYLEHCVKEECAWWVGRSKDISRASIGGGTSKVPIPPNYIDISGCAIKLLAERSI